MTPELLNTLREAFDTGGFSTKSDYARSAADTVAEAASRGYLSTMHPMGNSCRTWRLTPEGMYVLYELGGRLGEPSN